MAASWDHFWRVFGQWSKEQAARDVEEAMSRAELMICDNCKTEERVALFPFLWARVEIIGQDLNKHHFDYCPECWRRMRIGEQP